MRNQGIEIGNIETIGWPIPFRTWVEFRSPVMWSVYHCSKKSTQVWVYQHE
jgi:hypothetical protein